VDDVIGERPRRPRARSGLTSIATTSSSSRARDVAAWQIDEGASDACRPGLDLRILRSFAATRNGFSNRGHAYLPPGLAHFGVALDEGLTYSIGFRAPRVSDLLLGLPGASGKAHGPGGAL
jgi:hypothetical protein